MPEMNRYTYLEENDNRRTGFWISLLLHLFLLFLFLIPCFKHFNNQDPDRFQGVIIALGNPENESVTKTVKASISDEAENQKKATKATSKQLSTEAKKNASPTKTESATTVDKAELLASKKAKAEANIKAKEDERRRMELEKEKDRMAEEERKKQEEKSKAKSLFSNMFKSDDNAADASKGSENGKPNAEALNDLTSGSGKVGTGLGSRELLYAPIISDNTQKTGRVIINICVDQSGKVINTKFRQKGSTTTDAHLVQLAESSVRKYKFSQSKISEQCGDIIIDFKLK